MLSIDEIKNETEIEMEKEPKEEENGYDSDYESEKLHPVIGTGQKDMRLNRSPKDEVKEEPTEKNEYAGIEIHQKIIPTKTRFPIKNCIYCRKFKSCEDMISVEMTKYQLKQWNIIINEIVKDGQIIKGLWVCKTHFETSDVTETGSSSPNSALTFEKRGWLEERVVRTCVVCHSRGMENNMVKMLAKGKLFENWKEMIGLNVDTTRLLDNRWICKSHFKRSSETVHPESVSSDDDDNTDTAVCVFCRLRKPHAYLTYIHHSLPKYLAFWKRVTGARVETSEVMKNRLICKSHFVPQDFSKLGFLKANAIPFNGPPLIVERKCILCGSMRTSLDVAKVVMGEKPFENWKAAYGFRFNYSETLANPWICKSHFSQHDALSNGNLKPHAVPLGCKQPYLKLMCVYCLSTNVSWKMAVIDFDSKVLERWKTAIGITMKLDDIVKNPFICKSHFNTDDIKTSGCLKANSYPIDNSSGKSSTKKCVYCNSHDSSSEMVRIKAAVTDLEWWKNCVGIGAEVRDIIRNPWICKSHFYASDVTSKGVLKANAVPIDRGMRFPRNGVKTAVTVGTKRDYLVESKQQVPLEDEEKPPTSSNASVFHDHTYAKLC